MPLVPTPSQLAGIVARLRTAGCVFAEDEAQVLIGAAGTPDELDAMVGLRADGLPLEQVVGWAEFYGLRIYLSPGVFVPRKRSEFLVQQGAALGLAGLRPVVLDMCCGTGAVGVAIATALDAAELHASDIDPVAVACARRNVESLGGSVYQGDLYEPLPATLRGRVDILVANAPYVPTAEIGLMPAEARLHEPAVALDGGLDGVEIHRRVAVGSPDWLATDGHLLIETSERQATLTEQAVAQAGLAVRVVTSEDWATAVVVGRHAG
jgi:release factor glutamine methyltransferase